MRIATFRAPVEGGTAECSVIELAGDAGGLEANINRWRGQIGLQPATGEALLEGSTQDATDAGPVMTFYLENAETQTAMLVGVLSRPKATVFFKMSGPPAALTALREDFRALCRSTEVK
jgi:hypothetical protein